MYCGLHVLRGLRTPPQLMYIVLRASVETAQSLPSHTLCLSSHAWLSIRLKEASHSRGQLKRDCGTSTFRRGIGLEYCGIRSAVYLSMRNIVQLLWPILETPLGGTPRPLAVVVEGYTRQPKPFPPSRCLRFTVAPQKIFHLSSSIATAAHVSPCHAVEPGLTAIIHPLNVFPPRRRPCVCA